jgi:hypothetical protein
MRYSEEVARAVGRTPLGGLAKDIQQTGRTMSPISDGIAARELL